MKFLLRNLEDIVDFFERLEERLQECVDNELREEAFFKQQAEDLLNRANEHGQKAAKATAIRESLPNLK